MSPTRYSQGWITANLLKRNPTDFPIVQVLLQEKHASLKIAIIVFVRYAPSQWSKRMSPTEVVTAHGEVLKSSSKIYYYFPGYKIYKKFFFF